MTITINGSGTITGISAGGLPDGSVTEDDIATGVSNPIKQLDQWRLNSNTNTSTNAVISTNWERSDDATFAKIGSGLTESSGVFTFPETGIYEVRLYAYITVASGDNSAIIRTEVSSDSGSNWDSVSRASAGNTGNANDTNSGASSAIINVTDVSTYQLRFVTSSFTTGTYASGATSEGRTHFTVIRLGDSV
jgi:hypothetical protein